MTISRLARLCLILIIFCQGWATTKAQVTRQDADVLTNIEKESIKAEQDMNDFSGVLPKNDQGFFIADCAQRIINALSDMRKDVDHVRDLTTLSYLMINTEDRQTVNSTIENEINFDLRELEVNRRYVNKQSGLCSNSSAIANYVRMSLSLFNDVERSLDCTPAPDITVKLCVLVAEARISLGPS